MEIVFSDSVKGSMKCARGGTEIGGATSIGIIGADKKKITREEYEAAIAEAERMLEQQAKFAKPLGERAKDVCALSFALDIGDIASPVTSASRKGLLYKILGADPWNELADLDESMAHFWNDCVADLERMEKWAKSGGPVCIWYSDAPYSMCGFYHAVAQLEDCDCHVSAIKLPGFMPAGGREAGFAGSWGDILPGEFAYYLPLEREISPAVRKAIAGKWRELERENAQLRAVVNGRPQSVGVDFYDGFIRKQVPQGSFKVAQLIGLVLGESHLGIGDSLIGRRIKKMVEAGELTVVREDAAFYGTVLQKVR